MLVLAGELYGAQDVDDAEVAGLIRSLDRPLQLLAVGPVGLGTSTLCESIRDTVPGVVVLDGSASPTDPDGARAEDDADVYLVLLRPGSASIAQHPALPDPADRFRRLRTLGVLARADEFSGGDVGADGYRAQLRQAVRACRAEVTDLCRVVVPVSALARPTGLAQLEELVNVRFVQRAQVLKAWSVLGRLSVLVRTRPPAADAARLGSRIEQLRSGAYELVELDTVDALRSGAGGFTPDEVEEATRLLGESGRAARDRLGLDPGAGPGEVAAAASRALTVWRGRSSHPAMTPNTRVLAAGVARACEQILDAATRLVTGADSAPG